MKLTKFETQIDPHTHVTVWTARGSRVAVSQDDWLVEQQENTSNNGATQHEFSNKLRLAVFDGVTPWRATFPALGTDAAIWAALTDNEHASWGDLTVIHAMLLPKLG